MTAPQPLATTLPVFTLPLKGLFAFVLGIAPPELIFLTLAAGVLPTTVLPLAPAFFFFLAVEARSALDKLFAFARGKQRSGFFLSLDVPQGP